VKKERAVVYGLMFDSSIHTQNVANFFFFV